MGKSYIHAKVLFMQKTCGRPHACEQAPTPTPTPIFGLSSLTNRAVKRNRDLCPWALEKCEKTDWMYDFQTRSFVLQNAFGCIFCYIQTGFAECKRFYFNKFHFVKCKSQIVEYKSSCYWTQISNFWIHKFLVERKSYLLTIKIIYWTNEMKVISWIWKSSIHEYDKWMKIIYWKWKSFAEHIKVICWTSIIHFL